MSQELWDSVDAYLTDTLLPPDPALQACLEASRSAGLPAIQVAPNQGRLLNLIAQVRGARRILEIGTLGGYSTIWLARALPPDGRLISLEIEPKHAEVARQNLERADVADRVEIRVGRAIELLPALESDGSAPFDLVFIDADKPSNPDYFQWALKLAAPGGVIVVDNVVRSGDVAKGDSTDPNVTGVRRVLELMASAPGVESTAIQTVGSKGHDGLAIALVSKPGTSR